MKVSLTWLALVLIGLSLLFLGFQAKGVYEAFHPSQTTKEGFQGGSMTSDITITTCPPGTKDGVNDDGKTICKGDDGTAMCSLGSEEVENLESCSVWRASKLNLAGKYKCPNSMPNYYESWDQKSKGCTSGNRNADGTAPKSSKDSFCRIHSTLKEDHADEKSCTNQGILDSVMCEIGDKKRLVWEKYTQQGKPDGSLPPYVMCDYTINDGKVTINKGCAITSTYLNMQIANKMNEEYFQSTGLAWKDYFCPVAKVVHKEKLYPLAKAFMLDIKTGKPLPGTELANPKPPVAPAPIAAPAPPKPAPVAAVTAPVAAPPSAVEKQKCIFNANEYGKFYPDLNGLGGDANRLKDHYKNYGIRKEEGRTPCGAIDPTCKFSVQGYMDANPDVKKAYAGKSGQDLIDNVTGHYKVYGINENRPVCP